MNFIEVLTAGQSTYGSTYRQLQQFAYGWLSTELICVMIMVLVVSCLCRGWRTELKALDANKPHCGTGDCLPCARYINKLPTPEYMGYTIRLHADGAAPVCLMLPCTL